MSDVNIIADGTSVEHDSSVVPDPYAAGQSNCVWQMDPTNQFHEPGKKPMYQRERYAQEPGLNRHPPVSKSMESNCPESWFEWISIMGVQILSQKSKKANPRWVEVLVTPRYGWQRLEVRRCLS